MSFFVYKNVCIVLDVGNKPESTLKVFHFGKHCVCHFQDECLWRESFRNPYRDLTVGSEGKVKA